MFSGHVLKHWGNGIGPWQQLVDLTVRVTADDLCDDVGEVEVRFDARELAGLDQRGDDGPMLAAAVGAGEQVVLAAERYCPFILPVSGRNWKFITAGIPGLAARSASDRCRIGPMVGMSGCKFQPVRSC